jgi:hypothetical protein
MNWSGLNTVAVRIAGLIIFAYSFIAIMHFADALALVALNMFLRETPLAVYLTVLLPLLPAILSLVLGLLLFFNAGRMASWLGGHEPDAAGEAELRKLESALTGIAGLYFVANGAAEAVQIVTVTFSNSLDDWSSRWHMLSGRNFAILAEAITKIVMGLAFVLGRAGLARLVRKARKPA